MNTNKNSKKDQETTPSEEINTIAPTLIDNEELDENEKKIDLSSIIPEYNDAIDENQIELSSKDKMLKSDGSVILATISDNNIKLSDNLHLPEKIDINARKADLKKNRNSDKKIKKKKINISKKQQNIMSIVALVVIAIIAGSYYYYKNAPKDSKFKALNVTVEIGDSLPTKKSTYVKPGIGDTVDDLEYIIDTSNVILDKVGEYQYSVIHNNMTKYGIINIVDTTAPNLEVREVILKEGENYTPETFVSACHDWSGCNYGFEETSTTTKYTTPGTYVIYITAVDAYNNKTVKQASLVIEAEGMVKYFRKENPYDFNNGYLLIEEYELHFYDFMNNAILRNGIYTKQFKYQDEAKYNEFRTNHYGEINYKFDDANLIVEYVEKSNTVGPYYTRLDIITNYLIENNFIES